MAKYKQEYRSSRKVSPYPRGQDVVDMEVDCIFCKTRLYVPKTSLDEVLTSLKRAGKVILVCYACGQAQLVSWKMPRSRYLND